MDNMATPREPFTPENAPDNFDELFGNLSLAADDEENGRAINFDAQELEINGPDTANLEFLVRHNLERVPARFVVVAAYTPGTVYFGTTANTETGLYLKCSVAFGHFRILVY